jgi:phage tail-like protein
MPVATDSMMGLAMRFSVTIDNTPYDLGSWSRASGLEVRWDLVEHRTGDRGNHRSLYPGLAKYPNVTLERGVESSGTARVRKWLNSNSFNHEPQTGKIELLDSRLTQVTFWTLAHIIPVKWSIAPFESTAQKVAIETLELAHLGFLDEEGA